MNIDQLYVRSPSEEDRRTSLNNNSLQRLEMQDEQGRLTNPETIIKATTNVDTTAGQSGRKSSIPVLVRRRSVSACGDPYYSGHIGRTTPIADYIKSYVAAQMNMRKVVPSSPSICTDDRDPLGHFNSPSQHMNSSKILPESQTKVVRRPQSAVGFTQRATPASGRVLPVVPPPAAVTLQGRTGRSLPFTPTISNTPKLKPPGRSLPLPPSTNAQNVNKTSGRTLPATPTNAGVKLPASLIIDRCKSQLPKKSSQSQPGSRSTSPSSHLAYITRTQPFVVRTNDTSVSNRPRSCIPRGQSRETSPNRRGIRGGESGGPQTVSVLQFPMQKGDEMEAAVNTALLRHNLVSRLQMDNSRREDAASETSSISSDSGSRNTHTVMDVPQIIELLSSGVWNERRDGLLSLQTFLKSDGQLDMLELKKITELFTRMFHEPNSKVFVVFLEIIPCFVSSNAADVPSDWLYTCVSRLLERTSVDLLKSVNDRLQAALKSVRDTFVVSDQWASLARFVCESSKIADTKVRQSYVEYLHDMVVSMDSTELFNSSNVQQVVLRTIAWMSDRRFPNICRVCQHVIIALFNVNTPEFSNVLSSLPRSMRDNAFKLLQNHMATVSHDSAASDSSHPTLDNRPTPLRSRQQNEENLSAADFYASFKKTAEDIQNLNVLD